MFDQFERIAGYARLAVGIVGNPTTSEFALVDLTGPEPVPDFRGEAQRGFCFIGVVGMVQGVPLIALTGPLDNAALDALSQAYIRHVECVLEGCIHAASPPAPATVPVDEWLFRLWNLKDPRNG